MKEKRKSLYCVLMIPAWAKISLKYSKTEWKALQFSYVYDLSETIMTQLLNQVSKICEVHLLVLRSYFVMN